MKRLILLIGVTICGALAAVSVGQFQVQPQIDSRVGPIYPVNPSYNFYSNQNVNPFQFNWGTGHWDYIPFPAGSSSAGIAQHYNPPAYSPPPGAPHGGQPYPYVFSSPPQPYSAQSGSPPPNATAVPNSPPPTPDDTQLWMTPPTTQPAQPQPPSQSMKFEGRIVAIKAMSISADPNPHIFLRLVDKHGATGTADVGQRLTLPDSAFDPKVQGYVTVTGQLGILDGHLILFADQITFGSQTVTIPRPGRGMGR